MFCTKGQITKVNIDGSDDIFYRYKMYQLKYTIQGKRKMIKSILENINDVAKDIKIPPDYILAFIGYTLNVKHEIIHDKYCLSGDVHLDKMNEAIQLLINVLVLCQKCNLPELVIHVESNRLAGVCNSCGMKYYLPIKNDKFIKFVVRTIK